MIRIENWSVQFADDNPYLAPEQQRPALVGEVYRHPSHHNGKRVRTSPIVSYRDGAVTTRAGSTYELGQPDPNYLQWLIERGIEFNPDIPIVIQQKEYEE